MPEGEPTKETGVEIPNEPEKKEETKGEKEPLGEEPTEAPKEEPSGMTRVTSQSDQKDELTLEPSVSPSTSTEPAMPSPDLNDTSKEIARLKAILKEKETSLESVKRDLTRFSEQHKEKDKIIDNLKKESEKLRYEFGC